MDKEQALIILKELHKDAFYSVRTALETLIPEIKEESNDEKIRKAIIDVIKGNMPDNDYRKEYLAWLEKQSELKSAYLMSHNYTFERLKTEKEILLEKVCNYLQIKLRNGKNLTSNLIEDVRNVISEEINCELN